MSVVARSIGVLDERPDVEDHHRQLDTHFDATFGIHWCYLRPDAPANFTPELIQALRSVQQDVEHRATADLTFKTRTPIRYQVFASRIPGIFSLGGDLALFQHMIRTRDRDGLRDYARSCIDLVYTSAVNYQLPITTVSLVQGAALGGGFEAALAANVVVAERQSTMGFPEVLFNMFPGMGGPSLLVRRLSRVRAEQVLQSGRIYSAEELHAMGLVDVLADQGKGEQAVTTYIRQHQRYSRGQHAIRRALDAVAPLRYQELLDVVDVWVETALGLEETDMRMMQRLASAQHHQHGQGARRVLAGAGAE